MTSLRGPGGPWGPIESAGATGVARSRSPASSRRAFPPLVPPWSPGARTSPGRGPTRSYRDGAGWHPVELALGGGLPPNDGVLLGDLQVDGDGNAVTAWRDSGGVSAAAFDAGPPRFSAFSLPSGDLGAAPFSAAVEDAWSPVSIAWAFGDGAGAIGPSVTHAYSAAGTFTATATATDAVGNVAVRAGTRHGDRPTDADPARTPRHGRQDKDGIKDACDTSDGSSRPVAFKTVNAKVVSGEVFVKLPAGAARTSQAAKPPKGFVRLTGAQTIPVGSTLDTAKGRVRCGRRRTRASTSRPPSSSAAGSSSARSASRAGRRRSARPS